MLTIEQAADHILEIHGAGLTNRELQKLLYFAQGFHLAKTGEPLFNDPFHAWDFGPVNTSIWHKFKAYGYNVIHGPGKEKLIPVESELTAFLTAVVMAFGTLGQGKLIEYSHADVPWATSYIPSLNTHLSRPVLKDYFSSFSGIEEYLMYAQQKHEFHELVCQRKEYLSNLPQLGEGWISGKSEVPSEEVCAAARRFVSSLERLVFASNAKPEIPKLVLGPIPSGGVGLEFSNSKAAIYVHLHNNGLVEIDVERGGNFSSEEISFPEFEEDFLRYQKELLA